MNQLPYPIKSHITQLSGLSLRGVKNILAVASGKGGVGKSTIAVNLAVALAKLGANVGILDADIYGPSIPTMLGTAKTKPIINEDKYLPIAAHGIVSMSMGYLSDNNSALIWRGPMLAKSLIQMLDITFWDNLDYLILDLPPGTGDIQLSLVQKIPIAGALIVTTPQDIATIDAKKALDMFKKTNINILGLIENMSQHICSNCGHEEAIFGSGGADDLSKIENCHVIAKLPLDKSIREGSDLGLPSVLNQDYKISKPFLDLALKTALLLNNQPINYASKFPPIVKS